MQNFVLQTPSLQHLAQVKIVAELWSQRDVFHQIARTYEFQLAYRLRENPKKWRAMETSVQSKVCSKALPLPKSCKRQLLNLVKPLGMEVMQWCLYHNLREYMFQLLDNLLPQQLCWSMRGTIDYKRTAQLMVKEERVDVEKRYVIACINCLEDEARQLFENIPEDRRLKLIVAEEGSGKGQHCSLIVFSTRTLLGAHYVNQLSSQFHIGSFRTLLDIGSRATCEYLFAKLSPEEKEQVLADNPMRRFRRDADIQSSTCNLMHYLALQNEEQRERMFRECTRGLLIFLLRFPLQSLFMEAAERGWWLMDESDCAHVLSAIAAKIENGFHDYDYSQLFWQCWALSSADAQRHFLSVHDWEGLFATKEDKFTRLILNRAPVQHLERFARYGYIVRGPLWMDEKAVISDAALMECKETAALMSSIDRNNVEKRLRSEFVGRIVDMEMEKRMKRRM